MVNQNIQISLFKVLYEIFYYVQGLGNGILVLPGITLVQHYFSKRRGLASGIASAGASVGSLSCGPILQLMIDTYGWRGTLLIIGAVSLHGFFFVGTFREPYHKSKATKMDGKGNDSKEMMHSFKNVLCDCKMFNKLFVGAVFGHCLVCFNFVPFIAHIPSWAISVGIDRQRAAILPSAIGLSTLLGRLCATFTADLHCYNRLLMCGIYNVGGGIATLIMTMPIPDGFIKIIIVCSAFGFLTGGCTVSCIFIIQ